MVGVLLGLRLRLLRNQLLGSTEQVLLLVVGALVAVGFATAALVALVAARFAPLEVATAGVVMGGALVVVAWAVLPVLTSSEDALADPVRFALLPVPPRALALGLLASSALTPFAVATAVASLGLLVTYSRGPLALVVAGASVVLGTGTCLLLARLVLTAAAALVQRRRGREALVVVGVLGMSLLGFTGPAVGALGSTVGDRLDAVVTVVSWSPLGAVWALPDAAARGDAVGLLGRLAVAVATLAALAVGYERALRSRLRPSGRARGRPERGGSRRAPVLTRLVPDSPFGTLLERCLRYWRRDTRYAVSVLALPVVVLVLLLMPTLTGVSTPLTLFVGPFTGLLLGFTMLNELALDGGAHWVSLSAAVRGRDDRAARSAAMLVWGAPLVAGVGVAGAYAGGRPELAPALAGFALSTLLVGTAVAAVASVVYPFPVPPAGSNPFSSGSGGGSAALVQQGVSSLVIAPLLLLPTALLVWAFVVPVAGWLLAVAGPAYGAGVLAVGIVHGGRVYDRRGPELLARMRP